MKFLRLHRWWLCLVALAVAIMLGSGPAINFVRDEAEHKLANIKNAHAKTDRDLKQLRDDVAAARKLRSQMDYQHAEQILAPVDRLKCAEMLEHEADAAKLLHFTYILTPEEHVTLTLDGEPQAMASSAVSLEGDARDDVAVYNFVERVQHLLPGRAQLKQLAIERAHTQLSPASNVHFTANLDWLSNGTLQTVATVP